MSVDVALGLDDDRFRLSPRSSGGTQTSIDIWTKRTVIEAKAVIDALGLKGRIEHRKATDSSDYLLYRGRKGTHEWKGLTLEPSFDKRKRHGADEPEYQLDGITVE